MDSLTSLRRNKLHPSPVYIATLDTGEEVRASFWQHKSKPWTFDRARHICQLMGLDDGASFEWFTLADGRKRMRPVAVPRVVYGHIEHAGRVVTDPAFTKEAPPALPKAKRNVLVKVSSADLMAELSRRGLGLVCQAAAD